MRSTSPAGRPALAALLAVTALAACASNGSAPVTAAAPHASATPAPIATSAAPLVVQASAPAPTTAAEAIAAARMSFGACISDLQRQAVDAGIPAQVAEASLRDVRLNERIIELDRSQPEFVQTFAEYLDRRISQVRIDRGRRLVDQHSGLLRRVEAEYGVPGRYLVAFWGLESNFGDNMGGFRVMESLATLTCEGRRGAFFRSELFDAMRIVAAGDVTLDRMYGSWAGAMGQPQFMPSTFQRHAVDADGSGRRDIWGSLPDVFGSAGRFLQAAGWRAGEDWGQEVLLPSGFDYGLADLSERRSVGEWEALGVRAAGGRELAEADRQASILLPAGWQGPAFIVYPNFHVILNWNRSNNYALSVGLLADRIAGRGGMSVPPPADEVGLSRSQVVDLQRWLVTLGYDAGTADGIVGPNTRSAARAFQQATGLPADGYVGQDLYHRLRAAAGA